MRTEEEIKKELENKFKELYDAQQSEWGVSLLDGKEIVSWIDALTWVLV